MLTSYESFLESKKDRVLHKLDKLSSFGYKKFVHHLKHLSKDPKIVEILRELNEHFISNVDFGSPKFIKVKNLIPTQNEIDVEKSLKYQLQCVYETQLRNILDGKITIVTPLLVLNDKYILDGHHRWSQAYTFNSETQMECISIYTHKDTPALNVLKALQVAILSVLGKVPVAEVKGYNLLEVDLSKIEKYINNTISDKTIGILKSYNLATDKNTAVGYIMKNVKLMRANNQPINDAPHRDVMPQTDTVPIQTLRKEINGQVAAKVL